MKSINEYVYEKTGMTIAEQSFAEKMKDLFVYENVSSNKNNALTFTGVRMKKPILHKGQKILKESDVFERVDVLKNGWLKVHDDDGTSSTIMNYDIKESFILPSIAQTNNGIVGDLYDRFPALTAVQMGAIVDLQRIISSVKKMSLEDANRLKSLMGPSLEEKILRSIIDAVLFDTPPTNGQSNGL